MFASKETPSFEKVACPHCGKDMYVRYQKHPQMKILGIVVHDGVRANTKSNPDVKSIYDFWNSQDIITHRNMTPDIARAIKAELRNHTKAEMMQSIENYAEIQKGKQYWFNYAWTLRDFLKRGMPKFLDLEIAKANYINGTYKQNHRTIKKPGEYTHPDALRHD